MIQIIALLYAGENGIKGLRTFEEKVIPILREYKGVLITASYKFDKIPQEPDEIHVIQFPSIIEFESYKNDPRVTNLLSLKDKMISNMEVYVTDRFHQY